MKRSSGDKPIDLIEISDDDSPSKEPPQKVVRKEAEQFNSPAIFGMHENLVKMEKGYQDACRMAAEAQKRVEFLENLLDKKPGASEDTEKEELKKKLTEVSAKLEEATKENGEMIKKEFAKAQEIDMLKDDIAGLKRALPSQLQSQDRLIEDLQKKIHERSAELEKAKREVAFKDYKLIRLAKLESSREEELKRLAMLEKDYQNACRLAEEAQKRVFFMESLLGKKPDASEDTEKEELKKRIAETSTELEKEKSKAAIREEQLNRLAKLEKDFQGVCRIANEYEMGMNEAKARVVELENIIDKKPMIVPVVPDNTDKNLIAELQTKLVETSTLLEKERSDGAKREQQLQESVRSLTQRLEAEQARAREERTNNREIRIEQNHPNKDADNSSVPMLAPPTKTPETTTSPNLCEPSWSEDSITFASALGQLRSRYYPRDKEWWRKCRIALHYEGSHTCTLCDKRLLTDVKILGHFFSHGHINKMRERNAGMPRATFDYWMAKLDSIPKPVIVAPRATVTPKLEGTVRSAKPAEDPTTTPKATVTPKLEGTVRSAKPAAGPTTTPKATVTPKVDGAVRSEKQPVVAPAASPCRSPIIRKARNSAIRKVNTEALKRFLPQGTTVTRATAASVTRKEPTPTRKVASKMDTQILKRSLSQETTAAIVTKKEPTPTPKVAARTITAVVYPTVAEGTPATLKVQLATVAPTVTAPTAVAEVEEVLKSASKEGTDLDGEKDCSMV